MVPLSASFRAPAAKPQELRRSGSVPCALYGSGTEHLLIACARLPLHKAYMTAGESTLVEVDIEGKKKVPALFHEVQHHPVSGAITHVDFFAVDMTKEIEARVPIVFEGEAPATKELGGVLVTPHDHVTVRCLPSRLPHHLTVSLLSLIEFDSQLTVANLTVPEGVVLEEGPETVIATVQEPRKEEEIAPPPETGVEGAAGAEGAEGEKAEGDAGAASSTEANKGEAKES